MGTARVVLFDVDGTLLTTGGAGERAWALAFGEVLGVSADIADFTEDGMVDHDVARATFEGVAGRAPTEAEIATLLPVYLRHLRATVAAAEGYRVMPGLPGLLDRLRGSGVLLGVTTGNVEGAAYIKLGRGGLDAWFAVGGFGSDASDRAELTRRAVDRAGRVLGSPVRPDEVVVVGDTPRDVEAARAVGTVSVAVATGRYPTGALAAAGADHVLADLTSGFPFVDPVRGLGAEG